MHPEATLHNLADMQARSQLTLLSQQEKYSEFLLVVWAYDLAVLSMAEVHHVLEARHRATVVGAAGPTYGGAHMP